MSASQEVCGHLAAALAAHARRCQHNGLAVPAGLFGTARVLAGWAREGQEGSPLDVAVCGCDGAHVSDPLLLTKPQAAELLGVSASTVKRLIADGALRTVRIGGAVRIRRADLDAYVAGLAGPVAGRITTKAPARGPATAEAPVDPAPCRRLDAFDRAAGP